MSQPSNQPSEVQLTSNVLSDASWAWNQSKSQPTKSIPGPR